MPPFPNLPTNITCTADRYIVPVLFVWFLLRWFGLVCDSGKHKKAFKATNAGCSAGLLSAVVFLGLFRFVPTNQTDISFRGAIIWLVLGAIGGGISRFVPRKLVDGSDDDTTAYAVFRTLIIWVAYSLGLSAIVLYYSYSGAVHQSIFWAAMAFVIVFRFLAFLGD